MKPTYRAHITDIFLFYSSGSLWAHPQNEAVSSLQHQPISPSKYLPGLEDAGHTKDHTVLCRYMTG